MAEESKGTIFEKKVARIISLIEESDSEVLWNKEVPDPDEPKQTRQVDILVKRGDKVIHIECRDRTPRQGSMWIEELCGRKISLGADMMIAVSASGFTQPVMKKAERLGIILRDIKELTDEEVKTWGEEVEIIIENIKLRLTEIRLKVLRSPSKINLKRFIEETGKNEISKIIEGGIRNYFLNKKAKFSFSKYKFGMLVNDPFNISNISQGVVIKSIEISTEAKWIHSKEQVAAVKTFGHPVHSSPANDTVIYEFQNKSHEIGKAEGVAYTCVDLSALTPPLNCINLGVIFDLATPSELKNTHFCGELDSTFTLNNVVFKFEKVLGVDRQNSISRRYL